MSGDIIGYVDATCPMCGETYNGYRSHSCPPDLKTALASLLDALGPWAVENDGSHRKTDAALIYAHEQYKRSAVAEPKRLKRAEEWKKIKLPDGLFKRPRKKGRAK